MRSRKYSTRIVPTRKFVSPYCQVKIINGKPMPNYRDLKTKNKNDSDKIKYTIILNEDENLEIDLMNMQSPYCTHAISLKNICEPRKTIFLVVSENGRKVRCLVEKNSRMYYYFMQYLKNK